MAKEPKVVVPMYSGLDAKDRATIDKVLKSTVADRENGIDTLAVMADQARKAVAKREAERAAKANPDESNVADLIARIVEVTSRPGTALVVNMGETFPIEQANDAITLANGDPLNLDHLPGQALPASLTSVIVSNLVADVVAGKLERYDLVIVWGAPRDMAKADIDSLKGVFHEVVVCVREA